MYQYSKFSEVNRYASEMNKYKVKCKCGHKMTLINSVDKVICDWCGNYVYKNKKLEFRERMRKCLKKQNQATMK